MKLDRLYELRKRDKLNQEDVAKYLGVGRTTYAMYENGKREMDYTSIIKLADFYKVSLDYIFRRTNNMMHQESYSPEELDFMIRSLALYKEIRDKYNSKY